MCVTKKTNRRPHACTFAGLLAGSSSPSSPPSTLAPSSFSSSASPMISPIAGCPARPFHLKAEAEPSTSLSANDAATTFVAATADGDESFHPTTSTSCCRKRRRSSMVVSPPPPTANQQKSVAFSTATVVETVVPSSTMTDERKDELWYDHDTLESFKKAARRDSKAHRRRHRQSLLLSSSTLAAASSDDDSASSSSSDDDDKAPTSVGGGHRGLEHRISLERQRNKYVAQRAILECARRMTASSPSRRPTSTIPIDADVHLALVSSKVTRWSREVALSTGRNDFYAAYPEVAAAPGIANGCPRGLTLEQINARYPFPMSFKKVRPATDKAPTPAAAAATTTAGEVVVADLGPIPTKLNARLIQEDDSDDEHRRRLVKKRRMIEGASLPSHSTKSE